MKVTLHTNTFKKIGLGLLLTLNYAIEGLLLYTMILLIGMFPIYWSGIPIIGIFLFFRLVVSDCTCEEFDGDIQKFNYHYYFIAEKLMWIKNKIPLSIEVKE